MYFCETSTSRLYTHITQSENWAIISPYRSEYSVKANKERMNTLKSKVRNDGYGFIQFVSRWVEDNEAFDEESLFIPNISKEQAIKYGKEYEQSSIIIKDKNGCYEICTSPFTSYDNIKFNAGDTVRTFNITNDPILNISDAEEIFAKRKGGPASKPVKGNKPFRLSEVYELEQPSPSYFYNGYKKNLIYSSEYTISDAIKELNNIK